MYASPPVRLLRPCAISSEWRRQVLAGGYWLRDYRAQPDYAQHPRVHIFASGVMLEEALEASDMASEDGIYANVINVTSADRLFYTCCSLSARRPSYLDELLPAAERRVPAITLLDGHPLTLAWLGALFNAPLKPLGVVHLVRPAPSSNCTTSTTLIRMRCSRR